MVTDSLIILKIYVYVFGVLLLSKLECLSCDQRLDPQEKRIIYGVPRRKRFGMPEDYGWEGE